MECLYLARQNGEMEVNVQLQHKYNNKIQVFKKDKSDLIFRDQMKFTIHFMIFRLIKIILLTKEYDTDNYNSLPGCQTCDFTNTNKGSKFRDFMNENVCPGRIQDKDVKINKQQINNVV